MLKLSIWVRFIPWVDPSVLIKVAYKKNVGRTWADNNPHVRPGKVAYFSSFFLPSFNLEKKIRITSPRDPSRGDVSATRVSPKWPA